MSKTPNLQRWSAAKLDKELAFAVPANDGSPECVAWVSAIMSEIKRREASA